MKRKPPSLLNKIKSKYILKIILSFAYQDIDSVLKLVKYNKFLQNKLDILNIKKNYDYKYHYKIFKYGKNCYYHSLLKDLILFLLLSIYIILFYTKGKFNDKILKDGYNRRKKAFVDFIDMYILSAYLIFIIVSNLVNAIFLFCKKLYIRGIIKSIFHLFIFFVDFSHYICYLIKFIYSKNLLKEYILKNRNKKKNLDKEIQRYIWFYDFDVVLIFVLTSFLFFSFIINLTIFNKFGDDKKFYLNQIKGINIDNYRLPSEFEKLDSQGKIGYIFDKNNLKKYECRLNNDQIVLIQKINDIRKQNNIPILEYKSPDNIPDYMIKERTELIFYPNKNIYKLSTDSYILKYNKNEVLNLLNNPDIINIITDDILNRINILEKNDFQFIHIYNNQIPSINSTKDNIIIDKPKNDISFEVMESKNNIKYPKISINENMIDFHYVNTEDKFG